MSQTAIKYFTPQEAQKTLPLVKQIVRDILNNASRIRLIAESLGGKIDENEEIASLAAQISTFMKELEEIGCSYKDWNFQVGLVDFPAILDGEEVLLCWRSDEETVLHYHNAEGGYADRMKIPPELL